MANNYGRGGGYSGQPLATRGQLVPAGAVGTPSPPTVLHRFNPSPLGQQDNLPYGEPGVQTTGQFDYRRFVEAGGNLTSQILHPSITPFEQLYRRLPEEGMFASTVTPSNPFVFELGAFVVPPKQTLLLFDMRPDIYRFSGVDAGDYVPVEARRFSSIMGFDLTVNQKRTGEVSFQIDPVAIQTSTQQAFNNNNQVHPEANAGQFAIGEANKFASPAGAGTALLPQRPERYGALDIPFTIVAQASQTLQVRCVIFRPIPTPIAFIEYDIAGILVPQYWFEEIKEAIKPPQREGLESIR